MKSILVTGGAGYVGSHACKALAARGYTPVVLDNLSRGHKDFVRWGPLVVGDIGDEACVRGLVDSYNPIAVLHFAAFAYVGESMESPSLYVQNNVVATANFLEVLRRTSIRRIVFSSTCAVYGNQDSCDCSEDSVPAPISTYGQSKLAVEHMLAAYCRAYGFRSVSLRYFNAAGADEDGELGERHDPEPHILPNILRAAADGTAVSLFGNDYNTPDGTCVRDFTHVADLADAHVSALEHLDENRGFAVFNLGSERGYSLLEAIQVAREVTGAEIPVNVGPRRLGDPDRAVASSALAREILAWSPQRSRLPFMLETAWDWYRRERRIKA